jgi:hypothetical protein
MAAVHAATTATAKAFLRELHSSQITFLTRSDDGVCDHRDAEGA